MQHCDRAVVRAVKLGDFKSSLEDVAARGLC